MAPRRSLPPPQHPGMRPHPQVQAAAAAPGMLQKLARVFKEKAQQDLDRLVKGTSKSREKLGVRAARAPPPLPQHHRALRWPAEPLPALRCWLARWWRSCSLTGTLKTWTLSWRSWRTR